ncbi:hypothetical protein RchiOBHm_Chr7g0179421 [Rosa chinensis]|uniref:Uncharacterized protein n=1 Tax=Rosa chinensis TaxID=74649 RepID=A0A2P6P246_ROSCH|nr:hypothetical protein RchiOBHm_Chr7g0179421 [Rosa chinensis]
MNAKPSNSSSQGRNSKCGDYAPEFLCSACLCICCPVMVVWWCIKLPFKVGGHIARRYACGCGSVKKTVCASYSTASDIDLDDLSGKPNTCSLRAPRRKMAHIDVANQLQSKRG